jgi:ApbE superfamily uncharacterized protein (UPF0280 family)
VFCIEYKINIEANSFSIVIYMVYEKRKYRSVMKGAGLVTFQVMVKETDLWISAESDLTEKAISHVRECRRILETYIRKQPVFLSSMEPVDIEPGAPELIQTMAGAGKKAGVGPMASVAGAVAEFVGRRLLNDTREVIVENGGDIFLSSKQDRTVSIFAGDSPFSHKIGIRIKAERSPTGVCTSSGTVGHSTSFGMSDAVTVLSASPALADAAATAAGNLVRTPEEVQKGLDLLASIPGIDGGLIIAEKAMGVWGELELVKL